MELAKESRLRHLFAANAVTLCGWRLQLALKRNPNWHLQPRVPAGRPDGGRWTAGAAAGVALQILKELGREAQRRLKREGQRLKPRLRSIPRRWDDERQPTEDSFHDETRRISQNSWQRFGYPTLRFRTFRELKDVLGPAGPQREWHHIVEQRHADSGRFPPELIHSTDNIISLPRKVHIEINTRMSSKSKKFGSDVRRFWVEKMDWRNQYDHGLELIEEVLKYKGYNPDDF